MYRVAYQFKIMPLRGKNLYKMDQYPLIEPLPMEKNRGRPKNKRMRKENEQRPKHYGTKLLRKMVHVTCSICKQQGHNDASCLKAC